jgi:hypothetical protein
LIYEPGLRELRCGKELGMFKGDSKYKPVTRLSCPTYLDMGRRRTVMATAGGLISRRADAVPNIGTLDGTPVVMKTGSSVSEPALVCGVEKRPVAVEIESVAVAMEPVAMHAAGVSRSPMVSGGMMEPVVVNEVIAGVSQTPSERELKRRAVLASIQSNLQALILQINATTIQMSTWFEPVNANGEADAKATEAVVVDNGPICEMQVTSPPQERGERVVVVVASCSDTKPNRPVNQPREDTASPRVKNKQPAKKKAKKNPNYPKPWLVKGASKKAKKRSYSDGKKQGRSMTWAEKCVAKKDRKSPSHNGRRGHGTMYLTRCVVATEDDVLERVHTEASRSLIPLPEAGQTQRARQRGGRRYAQDARYSVHARGPDAREETTGVGTASSLPSRNPHQGSPSKLTTVRKDPCLSRPPLEVARVGDDSFPRKSGR